MIITLCNRDTSSDLDKVEVDLDNLLCTAKNSTFPLSELSTKFTHPLLIAPEIDREQITFSYTYSSAKELFNLPHYIFSILLHVNNPKACQFKIAPASNFQKAPLPSFISFSINAHQDSQDILSIRQLETLISQLFHHPFTFTEEYLINTTLVYEKFPSAVDAEILFQFDEEILNLFIKPPSLEKLELCFLNTLVGLAIFAKEAIKKDEIIGIYSGEKCTITPKNTRYMFENIHDVFNMVIDARESGNITRFINHAPKKPPSANYPFLLSNLTSTYTLINGVEVVGYRAARDIAPGEQLLIDYGEQYFEKHLITYFDQGHKCYSAAYRPIKTKKIPVSILRIFANHGIKKAQMILFWRSSFALAFFLLLISGLKYLL